VSGFHTDFTGVITWQSPESRLLTFVITSRYATSDLLSLLGRRATFAITSKGNQWKY
jgi:hypothetical protein